MKKALLASTLSIYIPVYAQEADSIQVDCFETLREVVVKGTGAGSDVPKRID